MRLFLKIFSFTLFFVALVGLGMRLFFHTTWDSFTNRLFFAPPASTEGRTELVIGFPDRLNSLNPTSYSASDRARLVNIYETLVRTDSDLRIEPSLALSWGRIDDTTYQFELRPDVKFHNGERLTSSDVEASFEFARNSADSQIRHLVASIRSFEILNEIKFQIITHSPDPLFLNKLTAVFIFPQSFTDVSSTGSSVGGSSATNPSVTGSSVDGSSLPTELELQDGRNPQGSVEFNLEEWPIGTGPYRFVRFDSATGNLELQHFDDYWGQEPTFQYVKLLSIEDKNERIRLIQNGAVDILSAVPASLVHELDSYDLKISIHPSIEVNFLAFNVSDTIPNNIFTNKKARQAVSLAINKQELSKFTSSYVTPHDQFVSSGIFGFNPEISGLNYDIEKARSLMREIEQFVRIPVTVDLPTGLETFGKYLTDQLYEIGFSPNVFYYSFDELQKKIVSGSSQLYLFGWRSELGDSNDFFESVVHTRKISSFSEDFQNLSSFAYGRFNASSYSNSEVDRLIEESSRNINTSGRLSQLHQIMKILMDDFFGVPLFESQVIYAMNPKIQFQPRLDGLIYAQDILYLSS